MAAMAIVFVTLPRAIAHIFSPDPAVIAVGARLLLVAAAFQLFDGVQSVTTGALRGCGDTRTPMIANLVAYWLIGLPAGSLLCFRFGWGALAFGAPAVESLGRPQLVRAAHCLTHRHLVPECIEPEPRIRGRRVLCVPW